MTGNEVEVAATRVRFLSDLDEAAFFQWLTKLGCPFRGSGDALLITVERKVSDEVLRELVALFCRYGIEVNQLAIFRDDLKRPWLANPNAYWFGKMF